LDRNLIAPYLGEAQHKSDFAIQIQTEEAVEHQSRCSIFYIIAFGLGSSSQSLVEKQGTEGPQASAKREK